MTQPQKILDFQANPIGPAPLWMDDLQRGIWQSMTAELSWLQASDRALLEIAVTLRGLLTNADHDAKERRNLCRELRACLRMLGASPESREKWVTGFGSAH